MMYWISFASDTGPLGVAIVEAETGAEALNVASRLKLNPGGQAMIVEIPTVEGRHEAWPYRNRLISREEIERIFGPPADPADVIEAAGDKCTLVCDDCNTPDLSLPLQ